MRGAMDVEEVRRGHAENQHRAGSKGALTQVHRGHCLVFAHFEGAQVFKAGHHSSHGMTQTRETSTTYANTHMSRINTPHTPHATPNQGRASTARATYTSSETNRDDMSPVMTLSEGHGTPEAPPQTAVLARSATSKVWFSGTVSLAASSRLRTRPSMRTGGRGVLSLCGSWAERHVSHATRHTAAWVGAMCEGVAPLL